MGRRRRTGTDDLPELPPEVDDEEEVAYDPDDDPGSPAWTPGQPQLVPGPGGAWQPPPPLWTRPPPAVANTPRGARQFRVQRLDNGRPQELGDIGVEASVADIVAKFGRPGTYWLMPVDMQGNPLAAQPFVKDISPDHEAFKMLAGAVPGAAPFVPQGLSPGDFMAIVQAVQTPLNAQNEKLQRQLEEALERAAAAVESAAQVKMAIAVDNTQAVMQTQEKLLDSHTERSNAATNQMLAMFQQQQATLQQQHQLRMQEEQMRREAEAQAAKLERQRLQDEQAFRMREREEEEKRRDKWQAEMRRYEREEAARLAADREKMLERQRAADREYMQLMTKTIEAKAESKDVGAQVLGLVGMAQQVLPALKELGLDKLIGGGGPMSWGEMIGSTISEGIKGMIELKKLEAGGGGTDDEEEELYTVQTGDGRVLQLTRGQLEQLQAQQQQITQQDHAQQQAVEVPQEGVVRNDITDANAPPQSQPNTTAKDPRAAAVAKLPVEVTKPARNALRKLVQQSMTTPEAQWGPVISAALATTQEIGPYIMARGLFPALIEAGANEQLANKIVALLDPVMPPQVPRR